MVFPIGVMTDSFRLPLEAALTAAQQLGAQGVQIYATGKEIAADMPQSARKELKARMQDCDLALAALCADFGHGFGDSKKNPKLIEDSRRILELAMDLGTNIITTHIGVIPENSAYDRYKIMQDACYELSRYADDAKAHFAVETGPERADVLKAFLDALSSRGVAVNMDPANFVMVTGDDPVKAVYTLKDYIVHTHAKDGRRLKEKDPEIIYGLLEEELQSGQSFIELPLGQGDVDFSGYLKALADIGYKGFLTIEREVGENPARDIRTAMEFLQDHMG